MDSYLEKIITCKHCGNKEKRGNFIWLNGEELCPSCYKRKRQILDEEYQRGYKDGYNKGYDERDSE